MSSASSRPSKKKLSFLFTATIAVSFVILCGAWMVLGNRSSFANEKKAANSSSSQREKELVQVEAIVPKKGGLPRTTTQPGSVHAFEEADLYAQTYGYLSELNVDIGDMVEKGKTMARISVPELEKEVVVAKALVEQHNAQLVQAKAKVDVAQTDIEAAEAAVVRQQASLKRDQARSSFYEKQYKRIQDLLKQSSIDERLVDEKEDQYLSGLSAVDAAKAALTSAEIEIVAAKARLGQANADVVVADAELQMAKAQLEKAEVLRQFGDIISPYDGVITERNVHVGDFIRDAQHGGDVPLLRVEQTNKMRVVVQIPDLYVPFTDKGDEAEVHIDALPNRVFHGVVSRIGNSENQTTRTMRTEIDLENPENIIRNGMYGKVTVILQQAGEGWTIPSQSLVGKVENGQGEIYVVKGGHAYKQAVRVGTDNGREVEILSDLDPKVPVVVRYKGAIGDQVAVQMTSSTRSSDSK